jgi:hypothetical protein
MTPTERFIEAHRLNFAREYPAAHADGHWYKPTMPKVLTTNGLTNFICKYLTWSGHRATRVNVQGRLIEGQEKQASGITLGVKKWIKGTTRKGSADISSTIKINGIGRSVMWEVKINKDRPSEHQLKEQELERRAGGEYFFVKTPEDFFSFYDSLFVS